MKTPLASGFRLFATLLLVACGYDNATAPNDITGTYIATVFTITVNNVTTDELAEGVTVSITLAADGTTTGSLVVPAAGATTSLQGTWSRNGPVVMFQSSTDTFLSHLPFQINYNQLKAEGAIGPGDFRVTLSR